MATHLVHVSENWYHVFMFNFVFPFSRLACHDKLHPMQQSCFADGTERNQACPVELLERAYFRANHLIWLKERNLITRKRFGLEVKVSEMVEL